jgi:hypothetical protein
VGPPRGRRAGAGRPEAGRHGGVRGHVDPGPQVRQARQAGDRAVQRAQRLALGQGRGGHGGGECHHPAAGQRVGREVAGHGRGADGATGAQGERGVRADSLVVQRELGAAEGEGAGKSAVRRGVQVQRQGALFTNAFGDAGLTRGV